MATTTTTLSAAEARRAQQQAIAEAKQKLAIAAFAARHKVNPTTTPYHPFAGNAARQADLAANAEKIRLARAVFSGTIQVQEYGVEPNRLSNSVLPADSLIGQAIQSEILRQNELASKQNLLGTTRYRRTLRIILNINVD